MLHYSITEEDQELAFEYIILKLLSRSIEKDLMIMEQTPFKLGDVHKLHLSNILKIIQNDTYEVKKRLNKNGIKILPREQASANFIRYPYLVRGHEAEFCFFRPALKNHVSEKMKVYYSI